MKYILFTTLIITALSFLYMIFYIYRSNTVISIRTTWQIVGDFRFLKYSYQSMMKPTLKNWYGFKMPKEEDFK